MTFDIRRTNLDRLNSMTKYPSIPTYHTLGEKGLLQDAVQVPFAGRILGTEKVDGTNARLVFGPDGSVVVGSREDLLWERRDLIGNPAMGIVEALRDAVGRLHAVLCRPDRITVLYVEVYGRNIGGAARQYTRQAKAGFRLFDAVVIENHEEVLALPAEQIARWRDQGGQKYLDADRLAEMAGEAGFDPVPALFDLDASALPAGLEETYRFLLEQGPSRCKLDEAADGVPEGVVVRSPDRSRIAKLRRQDYERTLRRRQGRK
jgi:AcrR family transcriptional regulator